MIVKNTKTTDDDQVKDWIAEEISSQTQDLLDFEELLELVVGGERFLIPLKEIEGIITPTQITPVPMAPEHFIGLANLHGEIVCIVDPCKLMRLKGKLKEDSHLTRFVRIRGPRMKLAIKIDEAPRIISVRRDLLAALTPKENGYTMGHFEVNGLDVPVIYCKALYA